MKQEFTCAYCKKQFQSIRTKKYCSSVCSNLTQYKKRIEKEGIIEKTSDAKKGVVSTEFFDWNEYPNTIII